MSVDATSKPLFLMVLHFENLIVAHESNIYNSALMLLVHSANTVQGSYENTNIVRAALYAFLSDQGRQMPRKTNPTILPHKYIIPVDIANDIVRSVDYYLQQQHVSQGTFSLLMPWRVWWVSSPIRLSFVDTSS